MLRCLMHVSRRICNAVKRAITALVECTARRLRQAWNTHASKVATNATYAAVTATVLAGALGLAPVTDVLSAVLGALLGVYANSQRGRGRGMNAWSDDWA